MRSTRKPVELVAVVSISSAISVAPSQNTIEVRARSATPRASSPTRSRTGSARRVAATSAMVAAASSPYLSCHHAG